MDPPVPNRQISIPLFTQRSPPVSVPAQSSIFPAATTDSAVGVEPNELELPVEDSVAWRILVAAGPIFADKGFSGATVREICDSADVNLASVNYYFGDKQQLYLQTVLLAREMRVQQVPTPVWQSGTSPEDKLQQFIEMILRRMVVGHPHIPWQVKLLVNEIQHPTDACQSLVHSYFRPFLESLSNVIGEVAGRPLAEDEAALLSMSVIGQCMIYRFAPETSRMALSYCPVTNSHAPDYQQALSQLTEQITLFSIAGIRAVGGQ